MNRKLIRPKLTDLKDQSKPTRRKPVPPEQTNAESFYYIKQMNSKTPMVVVLQDGEEIRGIIEWYDKGCLKVNRPDKPNLLVLKHNIKYIYKENDFRISGGSTPLNVKHIFLAYKDGTTEFGYDYVLRLDYDLNRATIMI